MSTEAVKTAVLSELRSTFSQTCNCDITLDEFTMATMLCDDNNMLTLSSDLLFSDQDGELTASSLLSSAASRLAGVRTFNDATLVIDTSCALRDAQGRCIEVRATCNFVYSHTIIAYIGTAQTGEPAHNTGYCIIGNANSSNNGDYFNRTDMVSE